jgi:prepilin-type N-terminal cleavage/methylation domain-containing protein
MITGAVNMKNKGVTLLELLIAVAISGIVFVALFHLSVLAGKQINVYIERYNVYNQIGYALEDMSARCPAASKILVAFTTSTLEQDSLNFMGPADIRNITPHEGTTEYLYRENSSTGALELVTNDTAVEVLVEGKYKPKITFTRKEGMDPNFLIVTIVAECPKAQQLGLPEKVVKAEGIKFWFIDVVRPK